VEKREDSQASFYLQVTWLLHLIRFTMIRKDGKTTSDFFLAFYRFSEKGKKESTEKKEKTKKKPKPKKEKPPVSFRERLQKTLTFLTETDLKTILNLTIKLLKRLLRALMPDKITVNGVIGFDDPYNTGLFIGGYEAASGMLGLREAIQIKGDFTQKIFTIQGYVHGKIIMIRFLWPVLAYCLKRPIIKTIFRFLKERD